MGLYTVTTGSHAATGGATKSIILLNPAGPKVKIVQVDISMDSSALAGGVLFDLYRVTTIGTPAGTSATPLLLDPGDAAASTTSLTQLTTEPTTVVPFLSYYLQPVGGLLPLQFPLGREPVLAPSGARVGLRYTTPASTTPDIVATITFQEG